MSNPEQLDKSFTEDHVYYTDPAFSACFLILVAGDTTNVLAKPGTILLSQTGSPKYFGTQSPVGKLIKVTGWISGTLE